MFVFGHAGLTAAAARSADREADLRLVALMALLPDVIDKTATFLLHVPFYHHNTRGVGHSLVGAAAVLLVLLILRPRRVLLLWACYLGHFALDRMWLNDNPIILLWPFLGPIPTPPFGTPATFWMIVYNAVGELLGLAAVIALVKRHRLFQPGRLNRFLRSGVLP